MRSNNKYTIKYAYNSRLKLLAKRANYPHFVELVLIPL